MITNWEILGIVAASLITWAILLALFVWAVSRFTRHVRGLHNMPSWEHGDIKDLKNL